MTVVPGNLILFEHSNSFSENLFDLIKEGVGALNHVSMEITLKLVMGSIGYSPILISLIHSDFITLELFHDSIFSGVSRLWLRKDIKEKEHRVKHRLFGPAYEARGSLHWNLLCEKGCRGPAMISLDSNGKPFFTFYVRTPRITRMTIKSDGRLYLT